MTGLSELVSKMTPTPKDVLIFLDEVNKDMFLQAKEEGDCLVHTTPYYALKDILGDGFLTGDPVHIKEDMKYKTVMHPYQVCFSSLPERHLSAMPNMPMILVTHDTYLKIPLKILKEEYQVKPIAYKIDWHDRSHLPPELDQHVVKKELIEGSYNGEFNDYIYDPTWLIENEWRVNKKEVILPDETKVFCANPRQKSVLSKLTKFPVEVDNMLWTLTGYQRKRYWINHWFDKTLKANGMKARHTEWNPDKNKMLLYDVFPIEYDITKEMETRSYIEFQETNTKRIKDIVLKDFSKFSVWFHDCTIDLASKRHESTCPNTILRNRGGARNGV